MSESPEPESSTVKLGGDGDPDPAFLSDQMKVTPLPCEIKEGEYNVQQLSTQLNQKENSMQMLVSQLSEMDQKKDDLLKELMKLHQTNDTSNFSDTIEELTTKLKLLKGYCTGHQRHTGRKFNITGVVGPADPLALEKEESQLLSVYEGRHADLPSGAELEKKKKVSPVNEEHHGSNNLAHSLSESSHKLNLAKKELAAKLRAIVSLKRQYDDVPAQTELIQYERRFSELYAQIQGKHRQTRKHYATYNALLEIKELMLKETSLLNSIDSQFQDAMSSTIGRSKLVDSMEVIVTGTKQKLDKAQLTLLAEQRICDSLKEKHATVVAVQRHFSYLLKAFQEECTRNEKLRNSAPLG